MVDEKDRLTPEMALQHKWIRALAKKTEDKTILKKLNISNMKAFINFEKIKKAALMAIAVNADVKDIEELRQIFQELDQDWNGSITYEELYQVVSDREKAEDVRAFVEGSDTDKSGAINYTGKSCKPFGS